MQKASKSNKSFRKAALALTTCAALLGTGLTAVAVFDEDAPNVSAHLGTLSSCISDFNEASARNMDWESLQKQIPDSPGAPVLIIPGFLGNDAYMSPLKSTLSEKGYATYGWQQGINTGPSYDDARGLVQRLEDIYNSHEQAKVSIVGYSLGGVYARELARAYPDMVQSVITLGAPFAMDDARTAEIQKIYADLSPINNSTPVKTQTPPSVPTTSLYSKSDWIVHFEYSLHLPGAPAEDIEVNGGHIMMPLSKEASTITLCQLTRRAPHPKP
jgi:pimeloyl-ACP methyl ester carboxylesterase